jgi:hypothetical protein
MAMLMGLRVARSSSHKKLFGEPHEIELPRIFDVHADLRAARDRDDEAIAGVRGIEHELWRFERRPPVGAVNSTS